MAFNILEQSKPIDTGKSADERPVGGLGIHFVKTLMDSIEYRREGNRNILLITKNFKPG